MNSEYKYTIAMYEQSVARANRNNKVRVVHSQSKTAWNIVGTEWGKKYKWVRIPYTQTQTGDDIYDTKQKAEALRLATFIADKINEEYNI